MTTTPSRPAADDAAGAEPVAVVSMAGRFPGAPDIGTYWANLCAGIESITRWTPDDAIARGTDPRRARDPRFVGAEGVLEGDDLFDAEFFGFTPREAELMDPQHRICLEVAWDAFDTAGYDPATLDRPVGVYLGAGLSAYLIRNLLPHGRLLDQVGGFPLLIHNDKDFLPSTVSYKLGLTGPSIAVGTACSSSLVAVHLAVQALQAGECDLALAGGVSLQVPARQGYVYREDGIYSPDGRCRAFGADAAGTVGGSGAGVVLLKRLSDARRDGDHVHALIVGSAVNNDGAAKSGYTAPGSDGQTAVIAEAQAVAGLAADAIGYVEAHGTGTPLGDAVEVRALTRAFRETTGRRQYCAIGSVKPNIGHLDAAAGVAGLIKTILAVEHGLLPASLHCQPANRSLGLAETPFRLNPTTTAWRQPDGPRRAGVSAFGIGGTNAHLIVQQAPTPAAEPAGRRWQPLLLSACDADALAQVRGRVAARLRQSDHPPPERAALAQLAITTAGQRAYSHRAAVVAETADDTAAALDTAPPNRDLRQLLPDRRTEAVAISDRPVVFLFPGQGALPAALADLAEDEPALAHHLRTCAAALLPCGVDLWAALRGAGGDDPAIAQPTLFAVEYALAQTLRGWGIEPSLVLGHSLGEYAAATVAGVFDLPEALRLVSARGRLSAQLPPGAMLAVASSPGRLHDLPGQGLTVAAVNAADQCVVSGPVAAVAALDDRLRRAGVTTHRLPANRAYHSPAVDGILAEYRKEVTLTTRRAAGITVISGMDGGPASADDLSHTDYWVRQLREPVRFDVALGEALRLDDAVLVEVGPGAALGTLALRHPHRTPAHVVHSVLPPSGPEGDTRAVRASLATTAARLWTAGVTVDRPALLRPAPPARRPLPARPLRRRRFWLEPPAGADRPGGQRVAPAVVDITTHTESLDQLSRPRGAADPDIATAAAACDQLCAALALRFLTETGVDTSAGARHRLADLDARLRPLPAYRRLVTYLLDILAEDAVLVRAGDEVVFAERAADPDPDLLAQRLVARFPAYRGVVELVRHCVRHYRDALREPGAALAVLYPEGRGDLLQRVLGQACDQRPADDVDRQIQALTRLTDHLTAGHERPLRVLEVGAGAGRLTRQLATALGSRADYQATDISPMFVAHLRREAEGGLAPVRVGLFDVTRDHVAQGYPSGGYDLVVGLDVVHATPDVPDTLRRLTRLLAPGGVLGLVETTATHRWLSMVWGLSEGWWSFADRLRDRTPLLDHDGWRTAVNALAGHRGVVLPEAAAGGDRGDAALILVQAVAGEHQSPAAGLPAALPARQPDMADWCYTPTWRRVPMPAGSAVPGTCLLFAAGPLGDRVGEELSARGCHVTVVRPAPGRSNRPNPAAYHGDVSVEPGDDEAVRRILGPVRPDLVVHAWLADLPAGPAAETSLRDQEYGLHHLLAIARGLGDTAAGGVRLSVVTRAAQDVVGGDLANPGQATVHAVTKVVPRELPWVRCDSIDLPEGGDPDRDARHVLGELVADQSRPAVAYRGGRRWLPGVEPARLPDPDRFGDALRPGGVYLVVGGLGGIGLSLAASLASLPATVVLTRRERFPAPEEWTTWLRAHPEDDPTALSIRRLRRLQEAGGQVDIAQVDVTDRAGMRGVVERVVTRHGPITGVIHAAGVPDFGGMIQRRTRDDTVTATAAKIEGTLSLVAALGDQRPEFVLLSSSIGTVLHHLKFGEVGYLAGHEFLNAYAAHRADDPTVPPAVLAVAWTDWLEAGMWAAAQRRLAGRYAPSSPTALRPDSDILHGITAAEGTEIFRRVLTHRPAPTVIISTQPLDELLAVHAAYTPQAHVALLATMVPVPGARRGPEQLDRRPVPETRTEQILADLWSELLGFDRLGIDDHFFDELGGDSLVALRMLARVREATGVTLPVAQFFGAPTIRTLAARLDGAQRPESDDIVAGDDDVLI
ncbi:SDR family NAD(P)-dependent oxidoreductase [Micromonospora sp. NPDC051296]|uniref:SDR family NAD(P)-dependent oxidoreductase n=1 Tax=Micromonospora sp. NPDC051296 TaxID=3155046 RepID=UPI003418045C